MTPPTTAPGGPATTSPVPAPNAAPTASACELVGVAIMKRIGAAASKILRIGVPPNDLNIEVASVAFQRRASSARNLSNSPC